jgi:hypothetical protein
MSDEDIESGRRWNEEVGRQLQQADYGIICLTCTNLDRPWMLFEAGALAKRFDKARVVPILIDLEPADVKMPLASFQGRPLDKDGMRRLVQDINALREDHPRPREQVDATFDGMWPSLEAEVKTAIKKAPPAPRRDRPIGDMLAEIVETVRRIERTTVGHNGDEASAAALAPNAASRDATRLAHEARYQQRRPFVSASHGHHQPGPVEVANESPESEN